MTAIPPITSGSSQEMIHYDWQVRVLPLNLADKALMEMQAVFLSLCLNTVYA